MRAAAAMAAAALLFCCCWLAIHPPLPQLPTGDAYAGLATARHLSRGEGLLNDTVYPLFTVYPWGRELPQPLLHRGPGLAFLLLPAWLLSGGDPVRAEALVRPVLLVVLGLTALLGLWGLHRLGAAAASASWLILLLLNPLLALAVAWGWTEVPAGLLLLALWLVLRRRTPAALTPGAALGCGALAALLGLVRQDLLWVPVLWWFAAAFAGPRRAARRPAARGLLLRRSVLAAAAGAALLAPWWSHVARHTGLPPSNPLADAVQLDLDEPWWRYPLLRGRTPRPLAENLAEHAIPALIKTRHGVRHYAETLGDWLPWTVWAAAALLWTAGARRRWRRHRRLTAAAGPGGLLAVTFGLMVLQYALLSAQETRHLLPLLPLAAWEASLLADRALRRRLRSGARRLAALAALTALATAATPPDLGGLAGNVELARRSAPHLARFTAAAAELPPGPLFSDTAVVPWRLDRPFVWSPLDDAVEAAIRAEVPALRDAPYLRAMPGLDGPDGP